VLARRVRGAGHAAVGAADAGPAAETLAPAPALAIAPVALATRSRETARVFRCRSTAWWRCSPRHRVLRAARLSLRLLRLDVAAPLARFSLPAPRRRLLAPARSRRAAERWLIGTLSGRAPARVTRALLPPPSAAARDGWMRLLAEREGLFSESFGMALFTW